MMKWRRKVVQCIASCFGFQAVEHRIAPARNFGVLIDYAAIRPELIQRRSQSLKWIFDPILQNGVIDFGCMFFTQQDPFSPVMRKFSTQEHLFCVYGTAEVNQADRLEQKKTLTLFSAETAVLDDLYNQVNITINHLVSSSLTDIIIVGREPYCRILTEHFAHETAWQGKRLTALTADGFDEAQIARVLKKTEPEKPAVFEAALSRKTALLIDYSNVDKLFTSAGSVGSFLKRGHKIAFGCVFVPQNYINTSVLKQCVAEHGFLYISCPIGDRPVPQTSNSKYNEDDFRPKDVDTVDEKLCAMARHLITHCPEYDEIIIMSGDGDFVGICREAQRHQKRVIIVGAQDKISQLLLDAADEVIIVPTKTGVAQ